MEEEKKLEPGDIVVLKDMKINDKVTEVEVKVVRILTHPQGVGKVEVIFRDIYIIVDRNKLHKL